MRAFSRVGRSRWHLSIKCFGKGTWADGERMRGYEVKYIEWKKHKRHLYKDLRTKQTRSFIYKEFLRGCENRTAQDLKIDI